MKRGADIAALFHSEKEKLYSVALRITGRHDEAEDAVQDAWLSAMKGLARFNGRSRVETWLYRITIRAAVAVRARRTRRGVNLDFEVPAPSGSDTAASKESAEKLLAALDVLSTNQRTVLALTAVKGLSAAEIGEILGIPEGTVWSRLSTARRALLQHWQPDND